MFYGLEQPCSDEGCDARFLGLTGCRLQGRSECTLIGFVVWVGRWSVISYSSGAARHRAGVIGPLWKDAKQRTIVGRRYTLVGG